MAHKDHNESSTEALLDELSSIFPNESMSRLLAELVNAEGNIHQTVVNILDEDENLPSAKKPRRNSSSHQTSLTEFYENGKGKTKQGYTNNSACKKQQQIVTHQPSDKPDRNTNTNNTNHLRSINEVLKDKPSDDSNSSGKSLPPLHLHTPEEIARHVPCEVIHNVLPKQLADDLFLSMLEESYSWSRNRWNLAGRDVVSPHTTSFYVYPSHNGNYATEASFWYNGRRLKPQEDVKVFTGHMKQAKEFLEPIVNDSLKRRSRLPLEYDGDWTANVAASTCYTGSGENVGWHSDALTYLGPFPTIASLSLGCTRLFRLRDPRGTTAYTRRTYQFTMSHNTLIIMHAGCQERFKHCVPPQSSIDVFKPSTKLNSPSYRSYTQRINITFRFYRPDFNPSMKNSNGANPDSQISTPICACGVPCILRPDAKGKAAASRSKYYRNTEDEPTNESFENSGDVVEDAILDRPEHSNNISPRKRRENYDMLEYIKFFWMCNAGAQNAGKSCGMFKFLDMEKEGRGPCIGL